MKNNTQRGTRRWLAAGGLAVVATSLSGCSVPDSAGILIPKPAEFFPALIAFLIIWAIFAKFVWPQILSRLDERQKKIQDDLDAAQSARQKSVEAQKNYEQQIAEANTEAEEIVSQAKKEAEEERSQILAKAQREAAATIAKGRGAVESERRKAMIELSGSVVDLSVQIASKIIGNELTEEQQRKLAEKYLSEVGKSDEH
jgi:F-type H+-transporting ATPase subunit b